MVSLKTATSKPESIQLFLRWTKNCTSFTTATIGLAKRETPTLTPKGSIEPGWLGSAPIILNLAHAGMNIA
jgi:hypothetical protein